MRKITVAILLAMALCFTSCEISKDFTFTLEKTFDVNYNQTTYSSSGDVDATQSSSDFDKYASDLKSVDVVEVKYLITSFTGSADQKIVTATVRVGPVDGSATTDIATISNLLFAAAAATEQTLTTSQAGEEQLQNLLLKDDHKARLYFSGTANKAPVVFQIKFKFKCKVKYQKKLI